MLPEDTRCQIGRDNVQYTVLYTVHYRRLKRGRGGRGGDFFLASVVVPPHSGDEQGICDEMVVHELGRKTYSNSIETVERRNPWATQSTKYSETLG